MDNFAADLTPDPDSVARLLELCNRYGVTTAREHLGAVTEADRHRIETGHALAFGCCRALRDAA